MESRLRSYAHLAAQEEADPWVPLEYHGESSGAGMTAFCDVKSVCICLAGRSLTPLLHLLHLYGAALSTRCPYFVTT